MSFLKTSAAITLAAFFALPVAADGIEIHDAYARSASAIAKTGAAFMFIMNTGDVNDRLIGVTSDVAPKVELHTHKDMGDGVMKMVHVEEGFVIPANDTHALARGGDHVMFMGLAKGFAEGEMVTITLTFENAGDVVVEIPVDLVRNDR